MAVSTTLRIVDQMTAPINNINNALNRVTSGFEAMQQSSNISAAGITTMNSRMDELIGAVNRVNSGVKRTPDEIIQSTNQQEKFNAKMREGSGAADGLANKIGGFVKAFLGIQAIRSAGQWISDSLNMTDAVNNANAQLKSVMKATGQTANAYQAFQNKASAISKSTVFEPESMISGAAEFATYMTDPKAILTMMGTLSNYAAGMSGGGAVGQQQMVDYATQLGKALNGAYDGLTKKGFTLTDQQKEIIKNGNDMQKALVISDVINESWNGLAEAMANTPQGEIIQMQKNYADVRQELGANLYPVVMNVLGAISTNMPIINQLIQGFGMAAAFVLTMFSNLLGFIGPPIQFIINKATALYNFIVANWTQIAPIINIIAAALMIVVGVIIIYNAFMLAATAITFLFSTPILIVVGAIIAVILAIQYFVNKFNEATGQTVSFLGVIAGGFTALGAILFNTFVVPAWNAIADFVNFIANAFKNPVAAIKILFISLAADVIQIFINLASGIEWLLNKIPGVKVDLTSGAKAKFDTLQQNIAAEKAKMGWEDVVQHKQTIDLDTAYNFGYNFGSNLENGINNFDPNSLFGDWGKSAGTVDTSGLSLTPDTTNNISNIDNNTGKMANVSEENLKYLRDIAERDTINRFTTAGISVDMGGITNHVSSNMDLDGIPDYLANVLDERLNAVAEGSFT